MQRVKIVKALVHGHEVGVQVVFLQDTQQTFIMRLEPEPPLEPAEWLRKAQNAHNIYYCDPARPALDSNSPITDETGPAGLYLEDELDSPRARVTFMLDGPYHSRRNTKIDQFFRSATGTSTDPLPPL